MTTFPFAETFTLHTRTVTGRDEMGNDVYADATTDLKGAFAPAGSVESVAGSSSQSVVTTQPTLYLEDGSPVPSAADRITARGVTYEVDGDPAQFFNPFTGTQPGAVVRLRKAR